MAGSPASVSRRTPPSQRSPLASRIVAIAVTTLPLPRLRGDDEQSKSGYILRRGWVLRDAARQETRLQGPTPSRHIQRPDGLFRLARRVAAGRHARVGRQCLRRAFELARAFLRSPRLRHSEARCREASQSLTTIPRSGGLRLGLVAQE